MTLLIGLFMTGTKNLTVKTEHRIQFIFSIPLDNLQSHSENSCYLEVITWLFSYWPIYQAGVSTVWVKKPPWGYLNFSFFSQTVKNF